MPCKIAVLERHSKPGRKLSATGNGHCNVSNLNAAKQKNIRYHSEYPLLFETVLEQFTPEQTIDFFKTIGIPCHTKENGKVYPFCEQAQSVISMFEQELAFLGIDTICNAEVKSIAKTLDKAVYEISGIKALSASGSGSQDTFKDSRPSETTESFRLLSRKVIVAAGGKASPALSSDGLGYSLLQPLNHTCTELFPAIVQLGTATDFTAPLTGTKWDAGISLMCVTKSQTDHAPEEIREILQKESGELLFTKYGISGPPVLQLARSVAKGAELSNQSEYYAVIDFLEGFSVKELIAFLSERIRILPALPIRNFLVGIVPLKLASAMAKKIFSHREGQPVSAITERDLAMVVTHLKKFPLKITGTTGWKEAQVTAGGIRCDELDPKTLESNRCKGLYITGELLDVDGDCGGFNLQFAWASGYTAGLSAAKSLSEEKADEAWKQT